MSPPSSMKRKADGELASDQSHKAPRLNGQKRDAATTSDEEFEARKKARHARLRAQRVIADPDDDAGTKPSSHLQKKAHAVPGPPQKQGKPLMSQQSQPSQQTLAQTKPLAKASNTQAPQKKAPSYFFQAIRDAQTQPRVSKPQTPNPSMENAAPKPAPRRTMAEVLDNWEKQRARTALDPAHADFVPQTRASQLRYHWCHSVDTRETVSSNPSLRKHILQSLHQLLTSPPHVINTLHSLHTPASKKTILTTSRPPKHPHQPLPQKQASKPPSQPRRPRKMPQKRRQRNPVPLSKSSSRQSLLTSSAHRDQNLLIPAHLVHWRKKILLNLHKP
ncbi:MAG: hypothetical protein Q9183_007353 [Haloplaca sp. 2 TL-2023]